MCWTILEDALAKSSLIMLVLHDFVVICGSVIIIINYHPIAVNYIFLHVSRLVVAGTDR